MVMVTLTLFLELFGLVSGSFLLLCIFLILIFLLGFYFFLKKGKSHFSSH